MSFNWRQVGDKVGYAEVEVEVAAGQVFRVETSPNGVELLIYTTPQGKVCHYRIVVMATESNA